MSVARRGASRGRRRHKSERAVLESRLQLRLVYDRRGRVPSQSEPTSPPGRRVLVALAVFFPSRYDPLVLQTPNLLAKRLVFARAPRLCRVPSTSPPSPRPRDPIAPRVREAPARGPRTASPRAPASRAPPPPFATPPAPPREAARSLDADAGYPPRASPSSIVRPSPNRPAHPLRRWRSRRPSRARAYAHHSSRGRRPRPGHRHRLRRPRPGRRARNRYVCTSRRHAPLYPPNATSARSPSSDATASRLIPSPTTSGAANAAPPPRVVVFAQSIHSIASRSSAATSAAPAFSLFPPPTTHQNRSSTVAAAWPARGPGAGPSGRNRSQRPVRMSSACTPAKHLKLAPVPPKMRSASSPHAVATCSALGEGVASGSWDAPGSRPGSIARHVIVFRSNACASPRNVRWASSPPNTTSASPTVVALCPRRAEGLGPPSPPASTERPTRFARTVARIRPGHDVHAHQRQILFALVPFESPADEVHRPEVGHQPVPRARRERSRRSASVHAFDPTPRRGVEVELVDVTDEPPAVGTADDVHAMIDDDGGVLIAGERRRAGVRGGASTRRGSRRRARMGARGSSARDWTGVGSGFGRSRRGHLPPTRALLVHQLHEESHRLEGFHLAEAEPRVVLRAFGLAMPHRLRGSQGPSVAWRRSAYSTSRVSSLNLDSIAGRREASSAA